MEDKLTCSVCGENLQAGDAYYDFGIGNNIICENCIDDFREYYEPEEGDE